MNTQMTALEQRPDILQKVTDFWGTEMLAEYISNILIVRDIQYEETLSFDIIFELTFLADTHKSVFNC